MGHLLITISKKNTTMTAKQKNLLQAIKWIANHNDGSDIIIIEVGKYKNYSLRTLKSLIDKKIITWAWRLDSPNFMTSSTFGMAQDYSYYVKLVN